MSKNNMSNQSIQSIQFISQLSQHMLSNLLESLLEVGPYGYQAIKKLIILQPNVGILIESQRYLKNMFEEGKLPYLCYWLATKCNKKYTLEELVNLQILYLHNNQLKELPSEIGHLTNLQVLDLHHNQLKELSADLYQKLEQQGTQIIL